MNGMQKAKLRPAAKATPQNMDARDITLHPPRPSPGRCSSDKPGRVEPMKSSGKRNRGPQQAAVVVVSSDDDEPARKPDATALGPDAAVPAGTVSDSIEYVLLHALRDQR